MPEQPKFNQQPNIPQPPDQLHNLSVLTPEDKQTPEYQKMRERIDAVKAEMKKVSEDEILTKAEKLKIISGELMVKLAKAQRFNKPKDKFSGLSELFEKLDIDAQYDRRYKTLTSTGVLEKLSTGEKGIIGIDKKEYPIPTRDEVKARIVEKEAMLARKTEQGLIKIIFVPFAAKLSNLTKSYGDTIKKHQQNGTLKATDGSTLKLDTNQPLWIWDDYDDADINGNLVYFPKRFDKNSHNGKTKQELLDSETLNEGWQILLIEDLPDLPAEGQGETIGQRKQLEANQTPKDYLNKLKTEGQYKNEQGLTPEAWLTIAATYLEENNQVIDDWQGQGKSCWNLGGYFPSSGRVPGGLWYRDGRQAYLYGSDAEDRSSYDGVRSSVMV